MIEAELKPRIVGLENEYALCKVEPPDQEGGTELEESWKVAEDRIDLYLSLMSQGMYALPLPISSNRFLENGARYYIDINEIPEYATPECLSFAEAVAYDIAGEIHATGHISQSVSEGVFQTAQLNKRVVDHSKTAVTLGAHENYHVNGEEVENTEPTAQEYREALGAHFVSRVVFCGAGSVDHQGRFHKSQKLRTLEVSIGGSATRDKAVVSTRQENLAGAGSYRVHVTSGDANISPWAAWMKLGTTSLMLRLLEHDMFPKDVLLQNIATAAHVFGSGSRTDTTVVSDKGKKLTALDIQWSILEQAVTLADRYELPAEELAVIEHWIEILDDLENNQDSCWDRVDWIARMRIIDLAKPDLLSRRKRDLSYDALYPIAGYGIKMRDKGGFRSTPGLEEVDTSLPPRNTRAFIRGLGVHALGAIECRSADVGWARLKAPGVPEFKMLDPYKHDPAAIQEWLSNF